MDMNKPSNSAPSDAHQVALELMKQLITLASGVIALSATFIEKFPTRWVLLPLLATAWVALLVCVFFSLQTISAIVKSRLAGDVEWSKNSGQRFARISKYTFLVGIFLFALFAFVSLLFIKIDETSTPLAIKQVIKVGPTSTVH
jgi:hypothetical protein